MRSSATAATNAALGSLRSLRRDVLYDRILVPPHSAAFLVHNDTVMNRGMLRLVRGVVHRSLSTDAVSAASTSAAVSTEGSTRARASRRHCATLQTPRALGRMDCIHRPFPKYFNTAITARCLGKSTSSHTAANALRHPIAFYSTSSVCHFAAGNVGSNTLTPFLLADIGEGIAEVEILQWYVKPGDVIQQFDLICQVQSDKATVDITSRYDGTVESLHSDGAVGSLLRVGQPLLHLKSSQSTSIDTSSSSITGNPTQEIGSIDKVAATSASDDKLDSDTSDDDSDDELAVSTLATMATTDGHSPSFSIHASPAVRKQCGDHGIDIVTLHPGSGPNGRILKADVLVRVSQKGLSETALANNTKSTLNVVAVTDANQTGGDNVIIPLRGYRRQMFKAMTAALDTPHMCLSDEIVMNQLLQARRVLNQSNNSSDSSATKISVLAMVCKAISCALLDYPILNSHSTIGTTASNDGSSSTDQSDELAIVQRADHNIGIAMDTAKGLVVPVIRQCQRKSIVDIQVELDRLKAIASSNTTSSFTTTDLSDCTLAISNIGSMGAGLSVHPVLAPPALAMIALGRIQTVPRFLDTGTTLFANTTATTHKSDSDANLPSIYAASVMTVTYAADHRFIEGATLARFHVQLAEYIQNPVALLSRLV